MTYSELVYQFSQLKEKDVIEMNKSHYKVISNHVDDNIFLVNLYKDSNMFHIFYDEINPETDTFTKII